MIRFAWLQSRTQTLAVAAILAALAVLATITGTDLARLYAELVAPCRTRCESATSQFLSHDQFLQQALDLVSYLAPAVLGVFWGAPLVAREIETGTHRLAWTQSVTRSRWLVSKLLLGGLATAALAGLLTLTITWWYRAVDVVSTNQYAVFDRRDITPIGYALFAFAAGALLGAVVRRTVPAMATTLGVFVAVRVAFTEWIRPSLLSPTHVMTRLADSNSVGITIHGASDVTLSLRATGPANAWTLTSRLVTATGQVPSSAQEAAFLHQHCPTIAGAAVSAGSRLQPPDPAIVTACQAEVARAYRVSLTYLPAGRYWTLQWFETGIFAALAVLAAASCYWWINHREK